MKFITIIPVVPPIWPTSYPPGDVLVAIDGLDAPDGMLTPERPGISFTMYERRGYPATMNSAAESCYRRGYDAALFWNSDATIAQGDPSSLGSSLYSLAACAPCEVAGGPGGADWANLNEGEAAKGGLVSGFVELTAGGPIKIAIPQDSGRTLLHGLQYAPLFAVNLEMFLSVGGFDTGFAPGYYEDADLFIRLRKHGHFTAIDPSVLYRHGDENGKPSVTFRRLYSEDDIRAHSQRNLSMVLKKHGIITPGSVRSEATGLSPLDPRVQWRTLGQSTSPDVEPREGSDCE